MLFELSDKIRKKQVAAAIDEIENGLSSKNLARAFGWGAAQGAIESLIVVGGLTLVLGTSAIIASALNKDKE